MAASTPDRGLESFAGGVCHGSGRGLDRIEQRDDTPTLLSRGPLPRRGRHSGYERGHDKPESPVTTNQNDRSRSTGIPTQARQLLRQSRARPVTDALHTWLLAQRKTLAKSDVTAKAIDYSLSNWRALTRYLDDGNVPIDNNAVENSIRPLAIGRKNWLFVGSQQAGERAAVMLSLIESAKLNGHDPWAYLKDVFERLPTLKNRDLELLLPHNWRPANNAAAPVATPVATAAITPVPATVEHSAAE